MGTGEVALDRPAGPSLCPRRPAGASVLAPHVRALSLGWAGGVDAQVEDADALCASRILQNCHDEATRFVHLLMNPGCNYLVQEDFVPFLQVGPGCRHVPHTLSAPHALTPPLLTGVVQRVPRARAGSLAPSLGCCLPRSWSTD